MEITMTVIKNKLSRFQRFRIALVVFVLLFLSTRGHTSTRDLKSDEIRITYTDSKSISTRCDHNTVTKEKLMPTEDWRMKIQRVVLGSAVIAIGDRAFEWFPNLEQVSFAAGRLTEIGQLAFANCAKLAELNLPRFVDKIGANAFNGCHNLTVFRIPQSTGWLGDIELDDTIDLEEFVLSGCPTDIGIRAFANCSGLRELHLCEGLKSIQEGTFMGCRRLTELNLEGITYIEKEAFADCVGLERVQFSLALEYIGRRSFAGCTGLRELILPARRIGIGAGAFADCISLKEVSLPDWLTIIPDGLFEGCKNLVVLRLPEGLTCIGRRPFAGCRGTYVLVLPARPIEIGAGAFAGWIGLKEVSLPDWLTIIPDSLFEGCENLVVLRLPEGLTCIGRRSFAGCTGLERARFSSALESTAAGAFEGGTRLAALRALPAGLIRIGTRAFYGCKRLGLRALPAGLIRIGKGAFQDCEGIRVIRWNDLQQLECEGSPGWGRSCAQSGCAWVGSDATRGLPPPSW